MRMQDDWERLLEEAKGLNLARGGKAKRQSSLCRFKRFGLVCLGRPGNRPFVPRAIGIFLSEFADHVAQLVMIVCLLVTRYAQPVNRGGRDAGAGIRVDHFLVESFRLIPFLAHEGHARESHQQMGCELVLWQIAFDTKTFFASVVEDEDRGSP